MLQQETTRKYTREYEKEGCHIFVELAITAIREYTINGKVVSPPEDLLSEMQVKGGVFVSLKEGGMLRGCIGTYIPTRDNIAEEIIYNAISAATRDPRFRPVEREELDKIDYSVDVLGEHERISGIVDLDPKRYGVIVRNGMRRGLLLPDIDGIDSADEQISIAREKAGILPGEPVEIFRFEVKRYR